MKILKLKIKGIKQTIIHDKLGRLTFDSEINNPSEYSFFNENGFSDLFEEVELKPLKYKGVEAEVVICKECSNEVCSCKVSKKNNKK